MGARDTGWEVMPSHVVTGNGVGGISGKGGAAQAVHRAERRGPGVTWWRAPYVIELCPRKDECGRLGNVTLDATDRLPYYGNRPVAICG